MTFKNGFNILLHASGNSCRGDADLIATCGILVAES